MKVATANLSIARYADALELSGASAAAARLRDLVQALEPAGAYTIDSLAQTCSGLSFSISPGSPRLDDLVCPLEGLLQLFEGIAKPEIVMGLRHLLAVVREHSDIPIAVFAFSIRKHVVSASKGQSKKGPAPMDQSLVHDYLKRLEAALGDDVAFRAIFRELEADKRVTKLEAVELATRFMSPTPPSTSRPKALQRVLQRHQKLVDFKRSSESIRRGRSAA